MGPLLDCLRELGGTAEPRQASDWIADSLKIPEAKREEVLRSGGERFHNQVAWARQYLVWEGLLDGSTRGRWTLTSAGARTRLNPEESTGVFKKWVGIHAKARKTRQDLLANAEVPPATEAQVPLGSQTGPESASGHSHREAASEVEAAAVHAESVVPPDDVEDAELLDTIQTLPPAAFERLCRRLLTEWGFEHVEVTGGSHDGGVDGFGVLQLNPFVSFQVAFQCKRYKNSVGREHVAGFRGSARANRADKLIMITTGRFTREAVREANGHGTHTVELIDGEKLVRLCQERQLGVRRKEVFAVDHAFFQDLIAAL